MNRRLLTIVSFALTVTAAALLVASLKLPLWRMRMESPQYREEEAIKVAVYPGSLRGDMREIQTLNQYIGVHVPKTLPQCSWLPVALLAAAGLGCVVMFLPRQTRRWTLLAVPAVLALALLFGAFQARRQMYDIGHKRNEKTPLRGVKDFTPPFLGKTKLFQFEVESWFGAGAYLIAGAIALQVSAAWLNRKKPCSCGCSHNGVSDLPNSKKSLA